MVKAKITKRALIQRINRKLDKEGQTLKTNRGFVGAGKHDLGRYYIVDFATNGIIDLDVDLEATGRELGVLQGWEEF
jgi:hypothetical protein